MPHTDLIVHCPDCSDPWTPADWPLCTTCHPPCVVCDKQIDEAREGQTAHDECEEDAPICGTVCPPGLSRAGDPCALDLGHHGPHVVPMPEPGNPGNLGAGSTWWDDYDDDDDDDDPILCRVCMKPATHRIELVEEDALPGEMVPLCDGFDLCASHYSIALDAVEKAGV